VAWCAARSRAAHTPFGYGSHVTAWDQEARSVSVADGRVLEVITAGPPDGVPVIMHHGTPDAAGLFNPWIEAGADRGLRHIGYSRPGFGGSTRLAGRNVADCAADVAAIADALGYDRFYTLGASGGGPHVIASAALLPDRVIAAASVSSPAPFEAEGLDWTAGMGQENLDEFAAMAAGDDAFEAFLIGQADELRGATAEEMVAVLGDLVSEVDRQALSGELADYLVEETAHALANGVWGWFDDDRAFERDWGFDLTDIRVPLTLWHGAQDRFVPIAHGEWLADHVTADAHLRPDHGHLSLVVTAYGEILEALLEHRD
jgi:pimeloyl-ACP methyl ester carboxylesterase